MLKTILRKEHKNQWEKRTPLIPNAISTLNKNGYQVDVESSDIRIFNDSEYQVSAQMTNTPDEHQLIIGIKEPPIDSIKLQQVHLCFSHTIKGQDYNMPLLQRFIDQEASLLDYELITDASGKRTIAFGEHAGIAGAIDTLWVTGKKLKASGKKSVLSQIKQTIDYQTIDNARTALDNLSDKVMSDEPIRLVIIGTGNVGRGSEKVCQWLGLPKLDAEDLLANKLPEGSWYSTLSSRHLHCRIEGGDFDLQEYLAEGKKCYQSTLTSLLGRFNILLQTSYWTDFYPTHLNQAQLKQHAQILPLVLGDITCDIDGSFSCTKKASTIDNPAFTYLADDNSIEDGISDKGITVMSIDNLPCELSLDASEHFSRKLVEYTPHLMNMDLDLSFDKLELDEELKKSIIVYKGKLTEKFSYLTQFL